MDWLSRGVEVLIEDVDAGRDDFDVVIVGSGYGGAVAASRLARAGRKVCVLERGREYLPGEFPNDVAHLPRHVRVSRSDRKDVMGEADALVDIRIGKDVSALVGSALGGTSQLNAAVAEEARAGIFQGAQWPSTIRNDPAFLVEEYGLARRMLGVGPYHLEQPPKKLTALRKLNRWISVPGTRQETRFRPLQVAIRQGGRAPGKSAIVPQKPCQQCGDCCSGCNYWAKNTLTMNYLPDARTHGACLYTGVSVLTVTPGARWTVHFRPTARQNDREYSKLRTLRADVVILAAGTFGSTEILMRSKRHGLLAASDRLGCGFSCNGDTLSFGYDQDEGVNAIGWGSGDPDRRPDKVVGPMAAAIIDLRDADRPEQRVVIEDGAIPGPLAHVAGELLTTAGMLTQLSSFRLKGDRIGRDTDPLAISPEAIDKTQVFLVMGLDAAAGQLRFGTHGDEVEGSLQVAWDKVGEQPLYRAVADILDATAKLGGIHIPNPIWKPLPDSMADVLSGPTPKGSLVTVHPLGGCRMADECTEGVVNHLGQVFDTRTTTTVHEGLYVIDGSIVPSALGINPLLTITALAERNVRMLATARGWTIDYGATGDPLPPCPDVDGPYRAPADETVDVRLREKLVGWLEGDPSPLAGGAAGHTKFRLTAELDFRVDDVLTALQTENRTFPVTGHVAVDPGLPKQPPPDDEVRWHNGPDGNAASPPHGERPQTGIALEPDRIPVAGTIVMLQRDRDGIFRRGFRAARYWWRLRGRDEVCREIHCPKPDDRSWLARATGYIRRAWSLLKLAVHAGERRFMTYRLEFKGRDDHQYVVEGMKTIAFADGNNVWRSLVDLDVEIKRKGSRVAVATGRVTMDFLDAVRNRPPQIEKQPHAPAAWSALASMAMFVARIIIKTYLWHFRAPDYPPEPTEKLQKPGPVTGVEGPERHQVVTADGVGILLSHYRNPAAWEPKHLPVVVTHGFAHSCAIFTADTVERCLVGSLCDAGFDVWLVELRTSTALDSCRMQWSFDQVAQYDLPGAVDAVLALTGCSQVNMLAHCMGAAVFSMGALLGNFDGGKKIRAAVLSQIGPYIVGSPSNQLRAELAAFLEDVVGLDHIDVSACETTDWLPALADRIAATYPVPPDEQAHHEAGRQCPPRTDIATCNRITAVYGRNWCHDNVNEATHRAMGRLLGAANMKTFRQITDFVQRGRVVFERGLNEYFLDDAVRRYMGFPIAFLHGAKSDVFDPDTSRNAFRRLAEIQDGQTHLCVVKKDYGHLDLWLGRNAHKAGRDGVHHHVVDFFGMDFKAAQANPVEVPRLKPAVRGPILGWTRRLASGTDSDYLRVWWEIDTSETDPPRFGVVFLLGDAEADPAAGADLVGAWTLYLPAQSAEDGTRQLPMTTYAIADVAIAKIKPGRSLWFGSFHLPLFRGGAADGGGQRHELIVPLEEAALGLYNRDGAGNPEVPLTFEIVARALPDVPVAELARARSCPLARALESIADVRDAMNFVIGSCRYPGTMFEAELADAPYREINAQLDRGGDASFLLMVGDQIYADATAGVFATESESARVVTRYRKAWSSPQFARMASRIPLYTTIDDHELWDNFEPTHEGAGDSRESWARLAYSVYQASFGRRGPVAAPAPGDDFHDIFTVCGFPFFAMDTRMSREPRSVDTGSHDYHIIGPKQRAALLAWLGAGAGPDRRPRFVICSSVFAPLWREGTLQPSYRRRDDGWGGYRASLYELIDCIAEASVPNVVFLSGDYHCSAIAEITIVRGTPRKEAVKAVSITASPFYAPLPFANGSRSDYAESLELRTGRGNLMAVSASHFVESGGRPGFRNGALTRVEVSKRISEWCVSVITFDAADGEVLCRGDVLLPC